MHSPLHLPQRLLRRATLLFGKQAAERDMDGEIRHHLEMEEQLLRDRGLSAHEARRQARLKFGGVERFKERAREARGTRLAEDLAKDVRFAARSLRKRPLLTSVVVATLGLGIGASVSLFGFVDAVLLQPLPYGDAHEVLRIKQAYNGKADGNISPSEHFDYERGMDGFAAYGAYTFGSASLVGDADPQRLQAAYLSHGVFPALGIRPVLGRAFTREEETTNAMVAVLSHSLWLNRYAGQPDIVGQDITLGEMKFAVVGVMPASFVIPEDMLAGVPSDIYLPLGLDPADWAGNRGSHFMSGLVRMGPGMSASQANQRLATLGNQWVEAYPDDYPAGMDFQISSQPMSAYLLGNVRRTMWTLLGAALLVLLLAAANVSSLMLGMVDDRRREFSVRLALGAERGRVVRQVLTESLLMALVAGVVGIFVALAGTKLLLALDPPNIPRLETAGLSITGVAVAFLLSGLAGLAFGIAPALSISAKRLSADLKEGGRGNTSGTRQRLRRALVAGELVVGTLVLVGAGLFTRSFQQLTSVDPGFRAEQVLTARINVPSSRYPNPEDVVSFVNLVNERTAALPGVVASGAIKNLPLAVPLGDLNFRIEGRVIPEGESSPRADWQTATSGYAAAAGLTVLQGRWFEDADNADAEGAVVISEATAELYWPGEDPLGARFVLGGGAGPGSVTVVGIVRDVRHENLENEPMPQMYIPHSQFRSWTDGDAMRGQSIFIRTQGDPLALAGPLRALVRELDPMLPVAQVETLSSIRDRSVSQPRTLMTLLNIFSLLGLVLAAIGVYGIVGHSVGLRTREVAVRRALGARKIQVVSELLWKELRIVGAGLFIGLAAALILARAVSGLLFGVAPNDPLVLAGVVATLGGIAFLGGTLAARRAATIDPALALRAE